MVSWCHLPMSPITSDTSTQVYLYFFPYVLVSGTLLVNVVFTEFCLLRSLIFLQRKPAAWAPVVALLLGWIVILLLPILGATALQDRRGVPFWGDSGKHFFPSQVAGPCP
jgi:hypothetical protein